MKILAGGLSPNLKELRLSFEGCNRLTDVSLSSLGNLGCTNVLRARTVTHVPRPPPSWTTEPLATSDQTRAKFGKALKLIYLDFIGCSKLTDTGLIALASSLPSGLEELELHFAGCSLISSAGVASLRAKLPRAVHSFNATFKGTGINRNFANKDEFLSG